MKHNDQVHDWVQDYYGSVLKSSEDLKTNACCATGAPPIWLQELLANIHPEVLSRFYGCGFPIPEAVEGKTILDLGCGTGRDVYLLSQLAGPNGKVYGVDMTESQLKVSQDTQAFHAEKFGHPSSNVSFHQAYIEDLKALPIEDNSLDVVISNCVVNLSPRKDLVMKEIFRLLKPGGEFYFSDVFCDRRLPESIAFDPILHSECLGGAMYGFDFLTLAKSLGFEDPRTIETAPITIQNDEISRKVGNARFTSCTLRLFKLEGLDARCEDYGQVATYRGNIPHHEHIFQLDDHHLFEAHRPERVCGNTAAMLSDTRLAEYFEVVGDKSRHFGVFDCSATMASTQYEDETGIVGGCC